MKLLKFAILAILFSTLTIEAQEISDTSFGKGIINYTAKDSTFSIKFAPRIQFRSETNWDYNGNNYNSPEHNFLIRRARLKF
ncbi:MAG TPA: porin, partial [Flavobacteriaceae bacterium]|nr:porin [Flavobacteriaceae bacterium]